MSLTFEFPEGHAYDFSMIVAGITAYLNESPEISHKGVAQWPIHHDDFGIRTPSVQSMCSTIDSSSAVHTCAVPMGGHLSPFYRIRVTPRAGGAIVSIAMDCADPIHEMIGRWRYDSALEKPKHEMT